MGTLQSRSTNPLQALFSPVQAATLTLLFGHPDQRFATNEIIRRIGSGSGAVQRQLAALVDADLVTITRVGNQKHYQANKNSPVFAELHGLMVKTAAFSGVLRDALMTLGADVVSAFVFGSVAAGTARSGSDLDLLVIKRDDAALDHATLYDALQGAEAELQRRIEPVLMTRSDWQAKRTVNGSFAQRVATGPTLSVLGGVDEVSGA
ncbi:MAG: transcriptional regulator [Gemmatimonas sp.]|nr:transcriptional regulator [Gemmatimonas sp.]